MSLRPRQSLGRRRHDIDIQTQPAQGAVEIQDQIEIDEVLPLRLDFPGEGAFIVEDERDIRALGLDLGVDRFELARDGRRHVIGLVWLAVRQQQTLMHLLLRERRLTPAKIAHDLGARREGLEGPHAHGAFRRQRIPRRPVHRPRLLLHDP